jgi:hypothetical protein
MIRRGMIILNRLLLILADEINKANAPHNIITGENNSAGRKLVEKRMIIKINILRTPE